MCALNEVKGMKLKMNIQINKRINLDKYKLITDKKIVYAKDKYLVIKLDNDYFHPKCNIIDINGNIILSDDLARTMHR